MRNLVCSVFSWLDTSNITFGFSLYVNIAYVILGGLLIWYLTYFFKKLYKKHFLEITKISFLFNIISFEYQPIKDMEKKDLLLQLDDKIKEIKILEQKLKDAENKTFKFALILLIIVSIDAIINFFTGKKKKSKPVG